MRVLVNYSDNFDIQYGNYFVTNRKTKEIISEFERARYKILGLDPYDSKRNYVYLTTQVTRLLRLQEINYSYGNGAIVYKSNYFCNGMWHFNLHINSNLNCLKYNLKLYLYSFVYLISIKPSIDALISSKPIFDKLRTEVLYHDFSF